MVRKYEGAICVELFWVKMLHLFGIRRRAKDQKVFLHLMSCLKKRWRAKTQIYLVFGMLNTMFAFCYSSSLKKHHFGENWKVVPQGSDINTTMCLWITHNENAIRYEKVAGRYRENFVY